MTPNVVWLDDAACHRTAVTGGKGASLGRMRSAGMPVPPGFVVTASGLIDTLEAHGVLDEVKRLVLTFSETDGREVAARLQRIVHDAPPKAGLAADIAAAYGELGNDAFVAVRSSACAEDGEAASFAGQQETFLNVSGIGEVLQMVTRCWASFFSERALFYRQTKGSLTDLGMAVVVQRQLSSDKSGVMFTTDPIRRRRDQLVIEAVYGLGEALVSGMVTPDNYLARRDGRLKKARIGRQDRKIVRDPSSGTVEVEVEEEAATARVLDDGEIARLVEIGLELESAFGSPQDIEWAYEDGELYVLQSRPITT